MHNCECTVYELLHSAQSFPIPHSYYIEKADHLHSGLILMDDMSKGAEQLDVFGSATIKQCLNLAELLADLQVRFIGND
jgi:hypothetical protein